MGKKYFAIPQQFRAYFPDRSELQVEDEEVPEGEDSKPKRKKRKRKRKAAAGSRAPKLKRARPGRPKKLAAPVPASQSLYRFFVKQE